MAMGGWQLRLSVTEKTAKRRANWLSGELRPVKPRKDASAAIEFDLNEAADGEDDLGDGSHNSSDLTLDHEDDLVLRTRPSSTVPSLYREFLDRVDDAIAFKPVDLSPIRSNITSFISRRFSSILGHANAIEVQDGALEKLSSGVWLGQTVCEEWIEKVLVPCFHQLKERLPSSPADASIVVRLELDGDLDRRSHGEWLPSSARILAAGL